MKMKFTHLYENPPFTMFPAVKSKSASSSTIQASLPPSSICRGTIPAFFEIAIPVSPPVKLIKENKCTVMSGYSDIKNGMKELVYSLVFRLQSKIKHKLNRMQRWDVIYLIQFTPGCIVRKSPISEPFPVTQLIRPFGNPAKWKQCTICRQATAPCKKWSLKVNIACWYFVLKVKWCQGRNQDFNFMRLDSRIGKWSSSGYSNLSWRLEN